MHPRVLCPKCNLHFGTNNITKHTAVCNGPKVKKIRGVDFDPNWGFKAGHRKQWNEGLPQSEKAKSAFVNTFYRKRHSAIFDDLSYDAKRLRVIEEQDHRCRRCGLDEWQGKPLVLEYEHKDGNNRNNARDNVEALCPNCHSLTKTWRGRNNTGRAGKRSEEPITLN